MNKDIQIFIVDNELPSLNRYQHCLGGLGYTNIQLFLNPNNCISSLDKKPKVIFLNRDNNTCAELLEKIRDQNPIIFVVILSRKKNARVATDILNFTICDYITIGNNDILKMDNFLKSISPVKTHQKKGTNKNKQIKTI